MHLLEPNNNKLTREGTTIMMNLMILIEEEIGETLPELLRKMMRMTQVKKLK